MGKFSVLARALGGGAEKTSAGRNGSQRFQPASAQGSGSGRGKDSGEFSGCRK